MLAKIRLHGGQNLGQDRRGSVIVQVNAAHNVLSILRFRVGRRRGSLLILAAGKLAAAVNRDFRVMLLHLFFRRLFMKKVSLCLVFVFFGVTLFSAAGFGQKRSITEKELFNFRWIGNPQISPDGKQVAFVRIVVDEKRDSYETTIWGVSVDGAEGKGFTSGKHDTSPQWSPD